MADGLGMGMGGVRGALDFALTRFFLGFTVFMGGFVFVEPSPYELSFLLLFVTALIAGLRLAPLLAIQILCLVAFNTGGLIALSLLGVDAETATYTAVSFYLALTAIVFAGLAGEDADDTTRIVTRAWLMSALIVALAGIAGYFDLFPGAGIFTLYGRAKGTFEDPNVYGPFLILPAMLLVQDILSPGPRGAFKAATVLMVIVTGLLLSFSRAAWAHLAISVSVLVYLTFVTSPTSLARMRVAAMTLLGLMAGLAVLAGLLSIPGVWDFFQMRASLVQAYDVGATGRFGTQIAALPSVLERPLGLGPHQFGVIFGQDPHNVYLNAFATYGWLGGIAYLTYVVLTLVLGARFAFAPAPWQRFHIAAFATFIGLALVGMVVDTDHWRHFYLVSGLIWGLSAASWAVANLQRLAPSAFAQRWAAAP